MEKIKEWTDLVKFFKFYANILTAYLFFNKIFEIEMVTPTLCRTSIIFLKKVCLLLSYEKQDICKGFNCGEGIHSTGWCGLIALAQKLYLQ